MFESLLQNKNYSIDPYSTRSLFSSGERIRNAALLTCQIGLMCSKDVQEKTEVAFFKISIKKI